MQAGNVYRARLLLVQHHLDHGRRKMGRAYPVRLDAAQHCRRVERAMQHDGRTDDVVGENLGGAADVIERHDNQHAVILPGAVRKRQDTRLLQLRLVAQHDAFCATGGAARIGQQQGVGFLRP